MTEKLYYKDSFIKEFEATVISCTGCKDGYEVVLDCTAFFPNEGGQSCDTGFLDGIPVTFAENRGGETVHILKEPLCEGKKVKGSINWEERFVKMQNHTGEHIVSGTVHNLFGYNNVGFHLGDGFFTCDFDGELTPEGIARVEDTVNRIVAENHPVFADIYENESAVPVDYRSKNEFAGEVRIVTVEGCDRCACCAPHLKYTGQAGMIKIISCIKYKGGSRLTGLCGSWAVADYRRINMQNDKISRLLSAKREETYFAAQRMLDERDGIKAQRDCYKNLYAEGVVKAAAEKGENTVFFDMPADSDLLLAAVNSFTGGGAAFCGTEEVFSFAAVGEEEKLKALLDALREISGSSGGGKGGIIRGRITGSKEFVKELFTKYI